VAYSVVDQTDPQILLLWNEFADGRDVVRELTEAFCEDFPSFCALQLKVRPKGGGYVVPFLFNQVQRRMWREMCKAMAAGEPLWFVLLKFRQAGMSTFWCAWLYWQMWRQRDVQTMVVAHQLPTAETMIETQRVFYDEQPEVFRPDLREGNHGATLPRGEIYFADRRSWELIHLAKNVDPRGQQVTHVLETEFAMYKDPSELNGALLPQLPPFGSEARLRSSFIIESTPKGQNEFYDLYWDAKKGTLRSFKALNFPWFLFDEQYSTKAPPEFRMTNEEKKEQQKLSRLRMEYPAIDGGGVPVTLDQMYWRRETINSDYRGNVDMFDQEYFSDDTTCFMLASKSVFRAHTRQLEQNTRDAADRATKVWSEIVVNGKPVTTKGPVRLKLLPTVEERSHWTPITSVAFEIHPHGKWMVWEPPVPGHKYVIGADPALGLEDGDNSSICVLDVTAARQVAEFVDTMGPERFALEIAASGYWYNGALLVPEINNIGYVVLKRLIANITYPNLYKWPKFDEVNKYTHKRGFETNSRTKQLMVSSMINYVEDELLEIASKELLGEMSTFEQRNEGDYFSFGAQKGRHDDRVMSLGLAVMGIDQTPTLVTELNRAQRKLPNARDLHLASSGADIAPTAIPKQIQDLITVRHSIPWNPLSESML